MACEKGGIISISMLIKVTFAEIGSLEEKSVAFTILCWETVGYDHTCTLISSVLRRLPFGEYANRKCKQFAGYSTLILKEVLAREIWVSSDYKWNLSL